MIKMIKMMKMIVWSLIFMLISLFTKRDKNTIVFGSWTGELYIDNSKYLMEHILKNYPGKYNLIWVGDKKIKNSIPCEVSFLEKDTFKTCLKLLRAQYFYCTQMHRADISKFNVYFKSTIIYLDHGLAIKRWAQDSLNYHGELEGRSFAKKIYYAVIGESIKYDYFATSSPLMDQVYVSSLQYRGSSYNKMLKCGIPRNDYLINNKDNIFEYNKMKDKYSTMLGFDSNKKIILYVPTFRKIESQRFTFAGLDQNQQQRLLNILKENNAVLIEKGHFVTQQRKNETGESIENYIIYVNKPVDIQELDLISDIQITDYSGCFLDYILLDKPVIHYIYDYEYYRDEDTGLYYSIEEYSAGLYTKKSDEVLDEIQRLLSGNDRFIEKRHMVRNKYLAYEDGTACERILAKVHQN